MQLERLNDNQFRCTLSKSDLEQRQLRISELAHGSSRAREIFHDLIQQACDELGFEVDNIPLMVEAIPVTNDCLILVVTKIEDPEELEKKLSFLTKLAGLMADEGYDSLLDKNHIMDPEDDDLMMGDLDMDDFGEGTESVLSGMSDDAETESIIDGRLDPLGLIAPFAHALAEAKKDAQKEGTQEPDKDSGSRTRLFSFHSLDEIIRLSAFLTPFYKGESILYKETDSPVYYLFLNGKDTAAEAFQRACTIASDFGMGMPVSYASEAYCMEHCKLMLKGDALETLNKLNS